MDKKSRERVKRSEIIPSRVGSGHEPKIAGREISDVRENGRHVGLGQTEPSSERCGVLIDRRRRYPPAARARPAVRIIQAAHLKVRIRRAVDSGVHSVKVSAKHRAAHHDHMVAPRVVGTDAGSGTRWLECAAEI